MPGTYSGDARVAVKIGGKMVNSRTNGIERRTHWPHSGPNRGVVHGSTAGSAKRVRTRLGADVTATLVTLWVTGTVRDGDDAF